MKQSTIILLTALVVVAGIIFFADARYGMHHYAGSSWGPGHMWDGDDLGPGHMWDNDAGHGHMWDDDDYRPSHMMNDAFMERWHDAYESVAGDFKQELEASVIAEFGQPIEGFEPQMFLNAYPGLAPRDFDGVDAMIGHYEYVNGELVHDLEDAEIVHSAAQALTDESYEQLLFNIAIRLDMRPMDVSLAEVIEAIEAGGSAGGDTSNNVPNTPEPPTSSPSGGGSDVTVCTDKMKQAEVCTMEYAPVCGTREDGTTETFSNDCVACSEGDVISYTPGECSAQ